MPSYRSPALYAVTTAILLTLVSPAQSMFCSTVAAAADVAASGIRLDEPQGARSSETEGNVIRFGPRSAWSANTRAGRSVGGTWTGDIDISKGTAFGTWTVKDKGGRIVLSGTWSAAKSPKEWRGSWRALIAGQPTERSGTWSSPLQLPAADSSLVVLFENAVQQAISGAWQSGGQSGAWSIRAVR